MCAGYSRERPLRLDDWTTHECGQLLPTNRQRTAPANACQPHPAARRALLDLLGVGRAVHLDDDAGARGPFESVDRQHLAPVAADGQSKSRPSTCVASDFEPHTLTDRA